MLPRFRFVAVTAAYVVALTGCTFDGTALSERACASSDECGVGACVDGYCQGDEDVADDTEVGGDVGGDSDTARDVDVGFVEDVSLDVPLDLPGDAVLDTGADADGGTVCEPAERYCEDEQVFECIDGAWVAGTDCTADDACAGEFGCRCERGECEPLACAPGARRCAGAAVTECDDAGRGYVVVDTCDEGTACELGACVEVDCVPSARTCVGETLVVCDASGDVASQEDCAADGAWCDDERAEAECVARACEPGSDACAADVGEPGEGVVSCDDRGAAWGPVVSCADGERCRDGACDELTCADGETTCLDLQTLGVCDDSGAGFDAVPCEEGAWCDADACVPTLCEPGTTRCSGSGAIERCDEVGAGWEDEGACPDDTTCRDGACVDLLCTPDTRFCDADGNAATCDGTGTGVSDVEPCAWRCDAGACQPSVCGDGIVDGDRGEVCDDGNDRDCDGCVACEVRSFLQTGAETATSSGPGWSPGESRFTIEAWVDASGSGTIAGLGETNGEDWVRLELIEGRPALRFSLGGGDVVAAISPTSIVGQGWTHVAGVRVGQTSARIYVDGILVGLDRPDYSRSSVDAGAGRVWVGSDGRVAAMSGGIDEVRVSTAARYDANFVPPRSVAVDDAARFVFALDDGAGAELVDEVSGERLVLTGASFAPDACLGSSVGSIRCGDGVRATWESCDDGGVVGGDGCSGACGLETGCASGIARPGAGGCYVRAERARSFDDARRACTGWDGDLATIGSAGENEWVTGSLGGDAWIGLTDSGFFDEGEFRWVSESGDDYRNWAPGEPNDGGSVFAEEDCVELRGDGLWNDQACDSSRSAICER